MLFDSLLKSYVYFWVRNKKSKVVIKDIEQKETYAYPYYPREKDDIGFYMPDQVIDTFLNVVQPHIRKIFESYTVRDYETSALSRNRLYIPEVTLSLEESKQLVIESFTAFDKELGDKARAVFNDQRRWQLAETEAGEAAGKCLAAHCDKNSPAYAVIKYEYDGTINDAVYLAHELGHLIADDNINLAGFSWTDVERHVFEIQAFFAQNILYDYLAKHQDPQLRKASQQHFNGEITRSLFYMANGLAALDVEQLLAKDNSAHKKALKACFSHSVENLLGVQWKKLRDAAYLHKAIEDRSQRDAMGMMHLHQHSMASLISAGLFLSMKDLDQGKRKQALNSVLVKYGPCSAVDMINQIHDISGVDYQGQAERAINFLKSSVITDEETPFQPVSNNRKQNMSLS